MSHALSQAIPVYEPDIEHLITADDEWAFDRVEVQAAIRHRRARVIESWPEQGFQGHFYLSRFSFDRTELARIELEYLLPDAELLLARASLLDGPRGLFVPLDSAAPNPNRWRKLGEVEQVAMYENLLARPRAWFVRRAALEWRDDLLTVIREGKFKDGSRFDPAETVLLEREDYGRATSCRPKSASRPMPKQRSHATNRTASNCKPATTRRVFWC
jgi:hypothetical protein